MELAARWAAGDDIPREEYYFTITPYFETSAPRYAWLQQTVAIGIGALVRVGVFYQVFASGRGWERARCPDRQRLRRCS
jgi:hypothetical protein